MQNRYTTIRIGKVTKPIIYIINIFNDIAYIFFLNIILKFN